MTAPVPSCFPLPDPTWADMPIPIVSNESMLNLWGDITSEGYSEIGTRVGLHGERTYHEETSTRIELVSETFEGHA